MHPSRELPDTTCKVPRHVIQRHLYSQLGSYVIATGSAALPIHSPHNIASGAFHQCTKMGNQCQTCSLYHNQVSTLLYHEKHSVKALGVEEIGICIMGLGLCYRLKPVSMPSMCSSRRILIVNPGRRVSEAQSQLANRSHFDTLIESFRLCLISFVGLLLPDLSLR
jgi:hypothetical protein